MQALPNDLLGLVCESLVWVECFALRLVCRRLNAVLRHHRCLDFQRVFRRQLEAAGAGDPDTILHLLAQSGNQLTGSFVLQALFGGVRCAWTAGDLDVLIFSHELPVGAQAHYSSPHPHNLYHWHRHRLFNHSGFVPAPAQLRWSFTHVGCERGRNYTERWFTPAYNYTSLADFVRREADFDFCAVLFDGRVLRVCDWGSLWTRSTSVCARAYRRLPYYQEGDDGQNIVGRLAGRIAKYEARGFNIDHDVPDSDIERRKLNDAILLARDIGLDYDATPLRAVAEIRRWQDEDREVYEAEKEAVRMGDALSNWRYRRAFSRDQQRRKCQRHSAQRAFGHHPTVERRSKLPKHRGDDFALV